MHAPARIGDVLLGITIAFLFGIFAANMSWNLFLFGAMGILVAAGIIFSPHGKKWRRCIMLFLFAAGAGILYYHAYIHWQTARTKLPTAKQTAFFGIIAEEPKTAGKFTAFAVHLSHPYAGTVDIFTSPNAGQYHYGDELWINGSMTVANGTGEPPVMFQPRLRAIAQYQGSWPEEMLINFKECIVQKMAQVFPADQAALMTGVLIGTTDTARPALKAQMETSGTSYIVNMYGYKIILATYAIEAMLKDHLSRKALLWATGAVIMFFVLFSGGAISAVRAAIMGLFAIVARGTGRAFRAVNAILFTAAGMAIANATILGTAAFQLSFLSFVGIYYLGPAINNCFHWTDEGAFRWKEHAMLSLSTNLAIMPVAMNVFGQFSLTSFISNILIMIPWLAMFTFGASIAFLSFFSSTLALCAGQIAGILLQYELFIIHVFSVFTIPVPTIFHSAFVVVLYYGTLIIFAQYHAAPS